MINSKKIFWLSILTIFTLLYSPDVYADDMLTRTAKFVAQAFKHTKGIVLVIGAFGIIGFSFLAIFGKMKWGWLSGIGVGLFVLAAAGAAVKYATPNSAHEVSVSVSSAGNDLFNFLKDRAINIAIGIRDIAFGLGGFGIIMFTFAAICGKINFKHLGYIFISLFMLSGAGVIINYCVGDQADLGNLAGYASPKSFTTNTVGDSYSSSLGKQ
ncbi:MAG: hypothetical protein J6W96_00450 [Alphaproteobacteria bacterium]|nr:hypothetical protein [Alphaproteobacteria bacterium]